LEQVLKMMTDEQAEILLITQLWADYRPPLIPAYSGNPTDSVPPPLTVQVLARYKSKWDYFMSIEQEKQKARWGYITKWFEDNVTKMNAQYVRFMKGATTLFMMEWAWKIKLGLVFQARVNQWTEEEPAPLKRKRRRSEGDDYLEKKRKLE